MTTSASHAWAPASPSNPRGLDVNLRARAQGFEYDAIVRRIAADRRSGVLDWGCGHGQVSARLAAAGVEVVPYDHRPGLDGTERTPLRAFPELEVIRSGDPVRLPFETSSFSAVLSCGVLEHVVDPAGSLAEHHRVLEAGGLLYIYKLPNRHSWLEWLARRLRLYYHGAYPHDRVYTLRSAIDLVERAGFRVEEARLANILPLTLTGPWNRVACPLWTTNRLLSRIPGLNRLTTNIELVARRLP